MTWQLVLAVFFAGKKSTASAHLPALIMFTTKLSFNSEEVQRTRSFLLLKALILQRGPLKQVQRELSSLCQKRETGKLNEKQQLTTLGWDVGSKWTNPKKLKYTLGWNLGSKWTNQTFVVFHERSSWWVEKQMARSKYTKWLDHWKSRAEGSLVNSWMFCYP